MPDASTWNGRGTRMAGRLGLPRARVFTSRYNLFYNYHGEITGTAVFSPIETSRGLSPGYTVSGIGAIGNRSYRRLSDHYRTTIGSDSGSGAIGHYRGTIGPFQIGTTFGHYRTLSGTIGLSGYRVSDIVERISEDTHPSTKFAFESSDLPLRKEQILLSISGVFNYDQQASTDGLCAHIVCSALL